VGEDRVHGLASDPGLLERDQHRLGLQMTHLMGQLFRREPIGVAQQKRSTVLDKNGRGAGFIFCSCPVKGRVFAAIPRVHVSPCLQQDQANLQVPFSRSKDQRCFVELGANIGTCAVEQEQSAQFGMPTKGCEVQSTTPAAR